jgi:hypothetical protein
MQSQPLEIDTNKSSAYAIEMNQDEDNTTQLLTLNDATPFTRQILRCQPARNCTNKLFFMIVAIFQFSLFNYIVIGVGIIGVPSIGFALAIWGPFGGISSLLQPTIAKYGTPYHNFLFSNKRTLVQFDKTCKKTIVKGLFTNIITMTIVYGFIVIPMYGTLTLGIYNDAIIITFIFTSLIAAEIGVFLTAGHTVMAKMFAEYRAERIREYIGYVHNTLLHEDPEIGTKLKALTKEQRKVETFARTTNRSQGRMFAAKFVMVGTWIIILLISAALVTTSEGTKNKLRPLLVLSILLSWFTAFAIALMSQVTAPSRAWNLSVQEQLNDASLAPIVTTLFGRRADFNLWLDSHELAAQRILGSKVSIERLGQVGSLLISGVLIVIYFVLRDELRGLL